VIQHVSDESSPNIATDPARIHLLALLALLLAVVVPPVGIVLAVLVLRRPARAARDGRLAIGALLVAVVVLLGELLLLLVLTSGSAATTATAGTAAPAGGVTDPKGVATACRVVVPALTQVRTDVGKVTSPDQYGEVLIQQANTIVTGAAATTDATFLNDVGRLSQAFQKAWQDSSNGKAPSAVADELTAAGAAVTRDCTAAGYHP
jgi:hypothetical protein